MIINADAAREADQRGTDDETSDEIHGQHHGVDIVKWMHGHRDKTLEWWALYFKKEESSL